MCGVCSAAAFQNDLWSHIGVSTDTEVHFIEIPSMFSCRTPFCCYDLQPSLHCWPVTITSLEIVLNCLAIVWKISWWSATMKFILCLYQQETRHFTWKSSQRSSIGRVDAILNDKIRNEKKKNRDCPWTTLTGKNWKFQSPNAGRHRIAQMEREFLFHPLGTEKGEFFKRCPFVPENFQSNCAYHLHLNQSKRKFCLNGKRPRCLS